MRGAIIAAFATLDRTSSVTATRLVLMIVTVLLSACSASGPLYRSPRAPTPPYALVVFMREPGLGGAAWAHNFYVDGQLVAKLDVNGYTTVRVKERTTYLHTGATPEYRVLSVTAELRPGQIYYFKSGRRFGGVSSTGAATTISHTDSVGLLSSTQAEAELKTYRYQKPVVEIID